MKPSVSFGADGFFVPQLQIIHKKFGDIFKLLCNRRPPATAMIKGSQKYPNLRGKVLFFQKRECSCKSGKCRFAEGRSRLGVFRVCLFVFSYIVCNNEQLVYMEGMMKMNSCELTASITAAANAVACKLSDDELSLLSAVLVPVRRHAGNHCRPTCGM